MGLEEIIKNIEADTKAKSKQIVDAANAEAKKIEENAAAEAAEQTKDSNSKADSDAKQLLTRELSRANIEGKGIYQEAVNGYINDAMQTLGDNLGDYTASAEYQKLLGVIAATAVKELGPGCTLMLQKRDLQKLRGAGKDAKITESREQFAGGLRGLSQDGKMYVDYSLEKIIESLKDGIAVKLLDQIRE